MAMCTACGAPMADDDRFCASCGTPRLPAGETCVVCTAPLGAEARYCSSCGAPVITRGQSERRLVTVLFADLVGSTSLGERLDPEPLSDVLGTWFEAMRAELELQGGTVEKYIGDAVVAVFGVPNVHEDDAARAARAAVRMLDRLTILNDELDRLYRVRLAMRIGINTGEVLAVREPRPGEAMVTGDAVNTAARLEQAAAPGQVLVSERTAKSVQGMAFAPAGELQLRGRTAPLRAFVLVDGRERAVERGVPGLAAPLVGRSSEVRLLRALFDRAVEERRPQLVTIYGDAGVGKSRLVREFTAGVAGADGDVVVVRGRCLPYGDSATYWPLAEVLKMHAAILDSDTSDVALDKLHKAGEGLLASHVDDAARAVAALGWSIGLDDPGFDRNASPREIRNETHAAWRAFFTGLAATAPTIVVIEDIHWADDALLDLLDDVTDRVAGPLLVLCPSRPELTTTRPTWGGGRRAFSSLVLDPLTAEQSAELVAELLDVDDLPASLRARLLERAEGNPFFLEELVRQLIDQGHIVRREQRWTAVSTIADVELPDTVQAVLAARMDLLDEDAREVLQCAAVVGRVFWTGAVASLLACPVETVDAVADELERRELVVDRSSSTLAGQRELVFKHVLTRDVAEATLARRAKGDAHVRVANWIEATAGARRLEFIELLAHHRFEAHDAIGDDPRADPDEVEARRRRGVDVLLEAATDAAAKGASKKATVLGQRAWSLAVTALERVSVLEVLGEVHVLDANGDASWDAFTRAVDIRVAELPDDRRAIARSCGRALESATRWAGTMRRVPPEDVAARYLGVGLDAAGPGPSEERARLLVVRSFWLHGYPDSTVDADWDDARRAGLEAVEMAIAAGHVDLALGALDAVENSYGDLGRYGDGLPILERRLTLVGQSRDPLERGDTFAMAAWTYFHIGRYADTVAFAERGVDATADEHAPVALHCAGWASLGHYRLGDWDAFLATLARCEELLGDRDIPYRGASRPWGVAVLVHACRGDDVAADRYAAVIAAVQELEVSRTLGHWLARAEARRGRVHDALALLDTVDALGTHGDTGLVLEARCDLVGDHELWDAAPELVDAATTHAAEAGLVALPHFAARLDGRASLAGGDTARAVDRLRDAAAGFDTLGARWEAAVTRLDLVRALRVQPSRDAADAALAAALPPLRAAGSRRELLLAEELGA